MVDINSINQLSSVDTVVAGDNFPFWKTAAGASRRVALSVLQAYLQANLSFPGQVFTTQYSSPASTGFNVTISDGDDDDENVHLILTPTGTLAAGTITLPLYASVVDKQEVLVNCTQIVTTLTVAGNGATAVLGAPTTLAANAFFRLKNDAVNKTWYRIG